MNAGYRILIFEPNSVPDRLLIAGLAAAGYVTNWCIDSDHAARWIDRSSFDLAIIGLTADASGLPLIDRLVASSRKVPVLISTAVDAIEMRVQGLQRGAMDYLLKPYSVNESITRIATALQLSKADERPQLEHEGIILDKTTSRIGNGTSWTDLTPGEFQALCELFEHIRQPISKQTLRACIPDGGKVSGNAIEVLIHRLRAKITPYGLRIRVQRSTGYVLETVDKLPAQAASAH
jgi:DNA-binding response OmpR family regulator